MEIVKKRSMQESDHFSAVLKALNGMGVSLTIDCVGTSWTLEQIMRHPISRLKFKSGNMNSLNGLGFNDQHARAMVSFAEGLGMQVVASDITDADQLASLKTIGCNEFRGDFFGGPQNLSDITARLSEYYDSLPDDRTTHCRTGPANTNASMI